MVLVVVVLSVGLVAALAGLAFIAAKRNAERARFGAIVDVDAEVKRLRALAESESARVRTAATAEAMTIKHEAEHARAEAERDLAAIKRSIETEHQRQSSLASEASRGQQLLDQLAKELRSVEGSLEDISFGLYKPHYKFDSPEKYKAELDHVHEKQKAMIRDGNAAGFVNQWTINGDTREGARMQKQYTKLVLRAFNGECDASIAKVNWNNASKMEERISKSFDAINQLGQVMTVSISSKYRDLKLAELRLEHELEEKKHEVADEQKRIREQMRDEERALQEAERAQRDAEAEEARFQKALEKAKLELGKARGEDHARLSDKISELQVQLSEARAKSFRAKSLAEMTKAGYVYIISNIGSFGEHVFKIGMTRRLEPMDRVRELGAASVPFPFDVHAMVYSDDAPGLETAFHQRFKDRSVNLINLRKEFFHVEIEELEAFAKERGLSMAFTKLAEAREFRESSAMRLAKGSGPTTMPGTMKDTLAVGMTLSKHGAQPVPETGRRSPGASAKA